MSGSVPSSNEREQRVTAVVAGDALHVDHLVDADDLGLDHLGDRGIDDCEEAPGIDGGHRDLRRNDIGKLRDRNRQQRYQPGDRGDERNDNGEPRPVDENGGQHGSAPRTAGGCLDEPSRRRRAANLCAPWTTIISPPFSPSQDDGRAALGRAELQRAGSQPCRPRREHVDALLISDQRRPAARQPAPRACRSRRPPERAGHRPVRHPDLAILARTVTESVARSTLTSTKSICPFSL